MVTKLSNGLENQPFFNLTGGVKDGSASCGFTIQLTLRIFLKAI